MEKIKGLIDAPFTPFDRNGDVNCEPIPAYAAMLHKNGLKGVFINGSSGEGYMLTTEERMALAEKWVASVPEGFKVIVHVGSCCLRESVKLAAHAAEIGAWGIGAMAPPFPKIGRIEELVKYCEAICHAAPSLPFYYYQQHLQHPSQVTRAQIDNLRRRLHLTRTMQTLGVSSLFLCVVTMFLIYVGLDRLSAYVFGAALLLLIGSLGVSIHEIRISVRALEIHLRDMER